MSHVHPSVGVVHNALSPLPLSAAPVLLRLLQLPVFLPKRPGRCLSEKTCVSKTQGFEVEMLGCQQSLAGHKH